MQYGTFEIRIHMCDTCKEQVLYSMFDQKWRHAKKSDCKGGKVVEKYSIKK